MKSLSDDCTILKKGIAYKGNQNHYLQLYNDIVNNNLLTNEWNIIYNEIPKEYSTHFPICQEIEEEEM